MAQYTVVLPSLGEDEGALSRGTVAFWLVEIGQTVRAGGDLLEIETDKAVFVVPSPVDGTLKVKLVKEDELVNVGTPLAEIETDGQ